MLGRSFLSIFFFFSCFFFSLDADHLKSFYWICYNIASVFWIFPTQGWSPPFSVSPALQGEFFTTRAPLEALGRVLIKSSGERERKKKAALIIKYLPQLLKPLLKIGHRRSANGQEPSQPCIGDLVTHFVKWERLIPVVLRTQLNETEIVLLKNPFVQLCGGASVSFSFPLGSLLY